MSDYGFIPAWKQNGTRRPFPSLGEAAKNYGAENVYFDAPVYEQENQCPWCGEPVNNKRRRYCSDECRQLFANATVWNRGRDPYSLRILYRDNFTCQDCGVFLAVVNEHEMAIPIDNGAEVHHIVPVSDGGGDEPTNLVTLCKKCHAERHRKLREAKNG